MNAKRKHSRRTFLGAGVGAAAFGLHALTRRQPLWGLTAESLGLELGGTGRDGDTVLVMLQLSGGNDGLNTVVPIDDPEYARARGRLALARKDLIAIGEARALHPSLKGMAELYKASRLAIVEGTGYPRPNRSHFKSMDIWHAADPTGRDLRYGWLGRALDRLAAQNRDPSLAVNISASAPLALNGARYKPISFEDPNTYRYAGARDVTETFEQIACEQPQSGKPEAGNPVLGALRRTADEAVRTSQAIREKAAAYRTSTRYPRFPLAGALRTVAGLIKGGSRTRVYYTYHGGYDTHTNQAPRHQNLLSQLDQSLTAFERDLETQGIADRVVVMLFSEFGRRVRPNASGGTDHGVAGPVLLAGSRIRGGIYGRHPSLTDLVQGDLEHTTDFRRVYATLLDRWIGVDSPAVLGGTFEHLGFLGAV